jgi:pimeloyl-ACP methyl ester carboxylesterase
MAKLETKYVSLTDIKIAYSEYGEGNNLILLHGNSENKNIFYKYQTQFFSNFHTYAIDSRGHGESISTDKELSINQFGEDVIGFCKQLGITKAYVIGYSDGGNISLFLGLKAPQIFERIIAISPNYLVSGTTDSVLKLFTSIYKTFGLLNRIGINMEKWIMRFRLMLCDIGISKEQLNAINTSMRFIYAEKDMIKEKHVIDIHENVPKSTILKIMKSSHLSIPFKKETIIDIKEYFGKQL